MTKTVAENLNKTLNSILSFTDRGGRMNTVRGYALLDRYNKLKSEAIQSNVWLDYCKDNQFDVSHDGFDSFSN